ncbi:MAG TPA: low-complexity protein [Gammaproteobacteria bacterium]|nr:low-complexity protein [Gammaproteobacteria bacterium]
MSSKTQRTFRYLPAAAGAVLILGMSGSANVAAESANPFAMTELGSGYMVAANAEGKCGEGKCGGAEKDRTKEQKAGEGKCGEGKCGAKNEAGDADKKGGEGKCGEGKCASA